MYGLKLILNYNESGDTRQGILQKKYGHIRFLAKPETIAVGGLGLGGGAVTPAGLQGDSLLKVWMQNS